MMPFTCSVPGCSNKRSGHIFPRESDRLEKWLLAIRMESFMPTKHSRVCRNHFTDEDYALPKDSVIVDPRPVLKKDAVPSIFPWNKRNVKKVGDSQTETSIFTNYHFKVPDRCQKTIKNGLKMIPVAMKIPTNIADKPMKSIPEFSKTNEGSRIPLTIKIPGHQDVRIPSSITVTPKKMPDNSKKRKAETIPHISNSPGHYYNQNLSTIPVKAVLKIPDNSATDKAKKRDDIDVIICERAIKYLSSRYDSDSTSSVSHLAETVSMSQIDTEIDEKCKSANSITVTKQAPYETLPETKINQDPTLEIGNTVSISVETQCDLCECPKLTIGKKKNKKLKETRFCIDHVMDITNDAEIKFFTGFKDYERFKSMFHLLGDDVNHLRYYFHRKTAKEHSLGPFDEFLLTIVKLRRNKTFIELGFKFCTSVELVKIVFVTWINFLFLKFKELTKWMPKDDIDKYIKYGKNPPCTIIIECKNIHLKTRKSVSRKFFHTNINPDQKIRVLVNVTTDTMHVSEVFTDSISEKELISKAKSSLKVKESSSNVENDSQGNNPSVTITKIQRVTGLSKIYRILTGRFDETLVPLANQIVFVCFMLSNFVKSEKS